MARVTVEVREIDPGDASLEAVWADVRADGRGSDRPRIRWAQAFADAEVALIACAGGQVVGVAGLTHNEPTAWLGRSVTVTVVHVRSGSRHSGVGQALMAGVAAYAERIGAEHVTADVPPTMRDANRFFAKLGFAPVVTRRATSTSALRKLMSAAPAGRLARLRARSAVRRTDT
jgi:GNAT superfamily N-acetyltransferase